MQMCRDEETEEEKKQTTWYECEICGSKQGFWVAKNKKFRWVLPNVCGAKGCQGKLTKCQN